ncbi:DUF1573 domain-containing protein [Flavobacterium kingsejongi]|uniref:DUF1573 domain-containing protein n=1 Tax=Flavobacterium kingsejongi TaxID=1678728 RepID=A0A2S1LUE8_9FLAO|nr:DUF1573 domain-containing protein [Flavobacterium kingsejongi]AWG27380.1 hypothetical protein FK004_17055 [Flavobacterium kingsejongi]
MKKLLGLMAVAIIGISGYAQSGPKIQFKTETIDYGTVTKDSDNGLRTFEFTNIGDAPLNIVNVQSSCGCTIPSYSKEPIMPGKTGKIEVKYNMSPGPIRKSLTVESNAVNIEGGRVQLKIKGNVEVPKETNIMEKKKAIPGS